MNLSSYFLNLFIILTAIKFGSNKICSLNMHCVKKNQLLLVLNLKPDSSISGLWFLVLEKSS